ncbi:S9 family peptidase [bacterium]|nr:S9 family peptidase [bacterium]
MQRLIRKLHPMLLMLLIVPVIFAGTPEKKPLDIQAIDEWNGIRGSALTHDGQWFAYYLQPNDGDGEVILRSTADTTEYRFKSGSTRFGRLVFSENNRWLAFTRYPSKAESKKAKKSKKPAKNKLVLVKLSDGEEIEFEKVSSFAFSGEDGTWLAMAKYSDKKGKDKPKGADLILRELDTEMQMNFGNVSEYSFNKSGKWLAMTIDASDQAGNGVWANHMPTGKLLVLDSDKAFYKKITWTEEGDALALLKGEENDDYEHKLYKVLGFKKFKSSGAEKVIFDPAEFDIFPEDFTVSDKRAPSWSENLTGISFGIHDAELTDKAQEKRIADAEKAEEEKAEDTEEDEKGDKDTKEEKKGKAGSKVKKDDETLPKLVIWHWQDDRLQSQQWVEKKRDENYSYLCYYKPGTNQFFRLADDQVRNVRLADKEAYAIGRDNSPYMPQGSLDGRYYNDIYVIDLQTGLRRKVLEKIRWFYNSSPDGTHFLYYKDAHFHTYDMRSGKDYNISLNVPTSFVDLENDINIINPPVRPQGWLKDGKGVLLSDNWDLWKLDVHGRQGVNLTKNGKTNKIRFQRRFRIYPDEKGIDFSQPQYFRMYGEWTKKGGIVQINKGQAGGRRLFWDDAVYSRLIKAENASVYLYTRETNSDFPDYYRADGNLSDGVRLTEANPQQSETAWCAGVKLIDYKNTRGEKMQGALYLPAGYEEGESYPTIVYMYEKLSQNANRYPAPRLWVYEHTFHTSNGYAVLNPDITYKINDPGISAVECILPCLDAAIASGIVDEKNVGIHGHSWGGYQTAFMITQTDRFKAAIAGAPLTNMISMYSSIYWNSGSSNASIFESMQGRFYGGFWGDNLNAYQRNSPVYFAQNVNTPLLLNHNDKDGAVDYNQGVEYFNTLRRMGKPVVMLEYKGENHVIRKSENQKDYLMRIKQYFDYHLKGAEAPLWWSEGVDYLDLDEHLKEQVKLNKRPEEKKVVEKDEKEKTVEKEVKE